MSPTGQGGPAVTPLHLEGGESTATEVLVVFPFCLDHVGHGNIQRVLQLCRHLAQSGFVLDLVYPANPRLAINHQQYEIFRHVHRINAGRRVRAGAEIARELATFYAGYTMPAPYLRPPAALTSLVRSLLETKSYRAVLSTYAWTAPIYSGIDRPLLRILDVQDIMHEHAEACRQATGNEAAFVLPRATEEYLWRQWDLLLAISPDDERRIRRELVPAQHVLCVRHAIEIDSTTAMPGRDDVAFYAGSDNTPNVQATLWLLDEVWPKVLASRPAARLRIAGLICRALPERVRDLRGVELLGFQQDLRQEIDDCGVVVAPYLYGSGLKIKVVEAASRGKAVVTTDAGWKGSGLTPGEAIVVADTASAYADALASLLGDSVLRHEVGSRALSEALVHFSSDACYQPVARAIDVLAPERDDTAGGLGSDLLERVARVHQALQPRRVVAWGNGSHTRALIAGLQAKGVAVTHIAQKGSAGTSVSPEGLPVAPPDLLQLTADDLVVLSSETFEQEMWRDVSRLRQQGVPVLGLYDSARVSDGLLWRLTAAQRRSIGIAAPRAASHKSTVVLWDARASNSRFWRQLWLRDVAALAASDGDEVVIALPAAATGALSGLPPSVETLPILEGRECAPPDATLDTIVRDAVVAASNCQRLLRLNNGEPFRSFVMVDPTASECLGLARVLGTDASGTGSTVWLHYSSPRSSPAVGEGGEAGAAYRLALADLSRLCAGRLILSATPEAAPRLAALTGRRVRTVNPPRRPANAGRGDHVVCIGDVSHPATRPLLEAIDAARAAGSLEVADVRWRSELAPARDRRSPESARGLAQLLHLELLDDSMADEMASALDTAAAVVVLHGTIADEWVAALVARTEQSGVPLLLPVEADGFTPGTATAFTAGDSSQLLTRLREHLPRTHGRDLEFPRRASALTPSLNGLLGEMLAGSPAECHSDSGDVQWTVSVN